MKQLSVVIPVYNEEKAVEQTVQEILALRDSIDLELILVNDGSTDQTHEKILALKDENIVYLRHLRNKGYGSSLKTGIRQATSDFVAITDADGTYPNDQIPTLLEAIHEHRLDMAVGARTGENVSYPFIKKIPKFFLKRLAEYVADHAIPDINSGLRIFRKDVAMKFFHLYPQGFSFTMTITLSMLCGGYDVEFFPVNYYSREGKSKIRPIHDTTRFFNLMFRMAMYFNPFKFFTPIIILLFGLSLYSLGLDVMRADLTQSSVLLPVSALLFFSLALLADLIVKKT
jgi:glycosyltransferase involved in cell wall biosynthesis